MRSVLLVHQIFLYAWNGICIYLHLLTRVFLNGGWGLIINNSPHKTASSPHWEPPPPHLDTWNFVPYFFSNWLFQTSSLRTSWKGFLSLYPEGRFFIRFQRNATRSLKEMLCISLCISNKSLSVLPWVLFWKWLNIWSIFNRKKLLYFLFESYSCCFQFCTRPAKYLKIFYW